MLEISPTSIKYSNKANAVFKWSLILERSGMGFASDFWAIKFNVKEHAFSHVRIQYAMCVCLTFTS